MSLIAFFVFPFVSSYSQFSLLFCRPVRVRKMGADSNRKYNIMNLRQQVDIAKWKSIKMMREDNKKVFKANRNDEEPKFGAGSEFGRDAKDEARRKKFGIISKVGQWTWVGLLMAEMLARLFSGLFSGVFSGLFSGVFSGLFSRPFSRLLSGLSAMLSARLFV